VMLVLLIIFMVTTPMMQEGIDVNLPKVEASNIASDDEPLVITITRDRRISLNGRAFNPSELKHKLESIRKSAGNKTVLLRADEAVPYGYVMAVMADMRKAGIEKVGMVTEPVFPR
ncbi:MAG: ExbD/TolR family protein, partial [Deltaproteobacteria bacterium]|nr:ExbD/TolR family protein [Deltaproteobacteria bacterium]